ncbi:NUDIX domain-containing protein [Christensenellaceae bacterium OttesenSCG-928-K19]|nr:NUDIX domain-containing protein [Christensenellaceae bacterium OttesenSCG-928-K19]
MVIRNSAKAIIIKDGKMLFTKCKFLPDDKEYTYLPPGGGQEKGEPLCETLKRELLEETGAKITVGDLVLVREYIDPHSLWGDIHQVEFFFQCELLSDVNLSVATQPDDLQVGLEWLSLDRLGDYRIYPEKLKECIQPNGCIKDCVYIGKC